MNPTCLVSTVQAADGTVMVWGIFPWHTLVPLVPAYLSVVAEHANDHLKFKVLYARFNMPKHRPAAESELSFWFHFLIQSDVRLCFLLRT